MPKERKCICEEQESRVMACERRTWRCPAHGKISVDKRIDFFRSQPFWNQPVYPSTFVQPYSGNIPTTLSLPVSGNALT